MEFDMEFDKEQAIAETNRKIEAHIPLAAQYIKDNPTKTSIISLKRKFQIGYFIAIRVMEALEAKGLVRKVALGTWEAIGNERS